MAEAPASGRTPPTELLRALAVLAEPPTDRHAAVARSLALGSVPQSSAYSDVFLFQLYPYASVHLGPEGMMGGEAAERVAGFWRAVGRVPPAEPDHLAALLGLHASLGAEAAEAMPAERALVDASREALLLEHLAPWVFAFLERVRDLAPRPYGRWAAILEEVLLDELARASAEALARMPRHLARAPALPDPRSEGADRFLSGLLAPVRSGVIWARADLAGVARSLDLGLRAGERRYALEHLLAQDAPGVLRALAERASAQARSHRSRIPRVGASAIYLARRAETTAELLATLADADSASPGGGPVQTRHEARPVSQTSGPL